MARKKSGYCKSRLNALRHGILARHSIMPWENEQDFTNLLAGVCADLRPDGTLQGNLAVEIAGIQWRKARLLQAEGAIYRSCLAEDEDRARSNMDFQALARAAVIDRGVQPVSPNMLSVPDFATQPTATERDGLQNELAALQRLEGLLEASGLSETQTTLPKPLQDSWAAYLDMQSEMVDELDELPKSEAEMFADWLSNQIRLTQERIASLDCAPAIKAQWLGQAYIAPALDTLTRYEAHLDRRLDRALNKFYYLKQMRALFPPTG